jgi:ferredoxin
LIISMPRFKSSSYQFLTGAVKNLYGVIPGTQKMRIHREFPEREDFAGMLLDLAALLPPRIAVIDGGLVMEGNGPIHGDIRREDIYIVSNSIFAADYAMALMMGYDPDLVPTVRLSRERGLMIPEEIEFNPPGEPVPLPDFIHPVTFSGGSVGDADAMDASVREIASVLVVFDEESCVKCGRCAENCPTGSINMNPYPILNEETCISCFCCNELCPTGAARLEKDLGTIWSEAMKNEAGK